MSKILAETECEVIHEEMITHIPVVRRINGWRGEARVIVYLKINGCEYKSDQVLSLRLKKVEDDDG